MNLLGNVFSSRDNGGGVAATGGGQSEDGSFSYGFSKLRGKRASMEDYHEARTKLVGGQTVGLFGVFDGHGGARAAEYVQQHLLSNLVSHPKFQTDTKVAIVESYKQTDMDYLRSENGQSRDAGSTASTAVLVGKRLLVANVGDSRAVMCRGKQALALSLDHKPNRSDERQRIEDAGGVVMWAGTWRVGGVLAVSRAFGDRLLKRFVIPEPEIQEEILTQDDDFLVLASDGLWDVLSNQDAIAIGLGQSPQDPQEVAKRLTEEAYRRGSADNITCVVVRFHQSLQSSE